MATTRTRRKTVHSLDLQLTPEQIAELRPLLQENGILKVVYTGATVSNGRLVLSYIACNAWPPPTK
jgi:hypothetical protein